jgi:hypothetical protein
MATLGLAVAGAAGAAMLGLPPGLGFAGGAIAGRMLFGTQTEKPQDRTVVGPRIRDLRASDSALGAPIPICYGTCRVAGQYIWSPPLLEEENTVTTEIGGGGGGFLKGGGGGGSASLSETTYLYFMNAAVGICEGPISGIRRIWADTKLIFDSTGDAAGTAARYYPYMRFYYGTEDQAPDTLIQEDAGADSTPAYRGLAYIVFDEFPLADFGNRRPTISVEIGVSAQVWPFESVPIWIPHAVTPDGTLSLHQNQTPNAADKYNITPEYDGWLLYDIINEDNIQGRGGRGMIVRSTTTSELATLDDVDDPNFFEIYEGVGPRPLKHVSVIIATMDREAETVWTVEIDSYERNLNPATGLITATSSGYVYLRKYSIDGTYQTESPWIFYYPFGDTLIGARVEAFHDLFLNYAQTHLLNWNKQVGSAWQPLDGVADDDTGYTSYIADTLTLQTLAAFNPPLNDDPPWYIWNAARSKIYPTDWWLIGVSYVDGDTALGVEYVGLRRISPAGIPGPITFWPAATFGVPTGAGSSTISMGIEGNRQRRFAIMEDHIRGMIYVAGYGILHEIDPETLEITRTLNFHPEINGLAMEWGYWHGAMAHTMKAKPWSEFGRYLYIARVHSEDYGGGSYPIKPSAKVGKWDLDDWDWAEEWVIGRDRTTSTLDVDGGNVFYEPYSHALIVSQDTRTPNTIWYLDRFAGEATPTDLETIVRDICRRCGLPMEAVDTDDLDDTVQGYTLPRRSSAISYIEPLRLAYFFDGADTDWQLKFRKRAKASSATIDLVDTAAGPPGRMLPSGEDSQLDYWEAPERIDVVFHDLERDHQQNDAHAKRPRAGTIARSQENLDIPVVFNGDGEPKAIADINLLERWLLRPFSTTLGPQHFRIEPCDVVTVNWRHGQALVLVIETRETPDLTLELDGVVIESAAYTSYASTVSPGVALPSPQVAPESGPTFAHVVQAPQLTANSPESSLYVAGGSNAAGWSGATLQVSSDGGATWETRAAINTATAVGYVVSGPNGGISTAIRDDSSMTVHLQTGSLASTTELSVAQGQQVAAIGNNPGGWELVGFRDVAATAYDNRFTLTGLLRGMAGTEHWIDRIEGPLNFVVLSTSSTKTANIDPSSIGADLLVRVISAGQLLAEAPIRELTYEGAGMLPWSPVNFESAHDTDLTFSWFGRRRQDNELRDNSEVGLMADEIPETYEIDLLDEDGAVVRTLTDTVTGNGSSLSSDSQTGTYTLADAIADFDDEHGWRLGLINADFDDALGDEWVFESGTFQRLSIGANGLSPYRGQAMAQGGPQYAGTDNVMYQDRDLRVEAWAGFPLDLVASGAVRARLSVRQGNNYASDTGQITLQALDQHEVLLAEQSSTLQEITPTGSWQTVEVWIDPLPSETKILRVKLRAVLVDGTTANTAFDRVRVHLNGMVGQRSIAAYQISQTVGRGHPAYVEL